jgi:hypothetical protein
MSCVANLLCRLAAPLVVGACIAAVVMGRGARVPGPVPEPFPGVAVHAVPRFRAYDGCWFPPDVHSPRVLDTETGVVMSLPLSVAERFELLSCSPWHDGAGRFHLVGRWLHRRDADPNALPSALGLARCRFPGGELLDQIPLDPVPTGNPCWYPDGSGRVLFAEGGRLFQAAFRSKEAASRASPVEPPQPWPLPWRFTIAGGGIDFLQDLHWPSDGSLSLRCPLLASVCCRQEGTLPDERWKQLWWLDLGPDGTGIVAAGRLIAPDRTEALARRADERHPVVGTTQDGTTMLAYLARQQGGATWELWLTPIARSALATGRLAPIPAGRKLAGGYEPIPPAFSGDGRWIYVVRHCPGSGGRLERVPVARRDEPLTVAARVGSGA